MVESTEEGLKFSWVYDPLDKEGNRNDKTMLMAFFTEKNESHYLISGLERDKQLDLLHLPAALKGLEAETYISFITDDRKRISNSVYTGKIMF